MLVLGQSTGIFIYLYGLTICLHIFNVNDMQLLQTAISHLFPGLLHYNGPRQCEMSVSSIDTKLSRHVKNKAEAAQLGDSVCVGTVLRGSGRHGGGVHSLMDWEELAGSCTTPGGK